MILSKRLVEVVASLFALAILCTTLVGPAEALLAQVVEQPSGCVGNASPSGNTSRVNLDLLCTSGSSFGFFTGAFASFPARDLFKDGLSPAGVVSGSLSDEISLASGNGLSTFSHPVQKVSIHLFNSVLTL